MKRGSGAAGKARANTPHQSQSGIVTAHDCAAPASRPEGARGSPAPSAERPLLAIGLVVLAMVLFSATDGATKFLTEHLAAQQILCVRYAVVLGVLVPLFLYRRGGPVFTTQCAGLHIARGLLVAISSLLFTFALGQLPLALCTAIGFVSPLYVTALSIPFLREKVGLRRWAAVAVGFVGVLLILRPGNASFQWPMLIPLLSSLCWAAGLIITRRMRGSERPLTVLSWSSLVGFLVVAPLAGPVWQTPSALQWTLLILLGLCNALAQYLVIHAFMLASASLLAPFSYSTMIWSTLIGVFVFGNFPDSFTLFGGFVLIAAGLYVWHRERVKRTDSTVTGASLGEAVDTQNND